MTCRELAELLLDFVQGELEEENSYLIKHHLADCLSCQAYLESYQITIQLTRQLPQAPMPLGLAQRLHAALKDLENPG